MVTSPAMVTMETRGAPEQALTHKARGMSPYSLQDSRPTITYNYY